jgi:hypothetical protein
MVVVGQWQRQFYGLEGAMVRAHYRQGKQNASEGGRCK